MLKRVDKIVLKSFFGPLLITYALTAFVFVMQFLWKYLDDIVGKGLETSLLLKMIGLFAVIITPMALPLAILLASNMVMGNLAENNELTAFKSSGVSLLRVMGSLIVVSVIMAFSAFYFSNNVLPKVNLKFYSLLYDVRKQKPALELKEGVFYRGISGFAIRIGRKDPDNKRVYDIMVYDHTSGKGNDNLVMADKGEVTLSNSGQYLILTLNNGKQYQKVEKRKSEYGRSGDELIIMEFRQWRKVFDLSEFKMSRTDQSLFKSHFVMYNTRQLRQNADSMQRDMDAKYAEFRQADGIYLSPFRDTTYWYSFPAYAAADSLNVEGRLAARSFDKRIISNAVSNASSLVNSLSTAKDEINWRMSYFNQYMCEWYRKFSLSFACVVLLFVGSVMGAIVRKGGFGVPILISVLYFVLFHTLNVTGEKLAKAGVVPVFFGMWLSTIVLLPLALLLTWKAVNDSVLFRGEWYKNVFIAVYSRVVKRFRD